MPEFVIEKNMIGLGQLAPHEQQQTARKSCSALHNIAPGIEWIQSYLTENKVYCVYRAPSEQILRDYIELAGSEIVSISEVHTIIRPTEPSG